MRIAQIIFDFGLGGIQKGGCVLAESMAKLGHEAAVVGRDGPRYRASTPAHLHHILASDTTPEAVIFALRDFKPDVVHIHHSHYAPALLQAISKQMPNVLLVSTPVFGRQPDDASLLQISRTCLVGCYAFYRFCKWGQISPQQAIERGVGYVPITPFEAPAHAYSTLDDSETIRTRRSGFGTPFRTFVVGRIGRNHISKWFLQHEKLIDDLLAADERIQWLSIGYPEELGRQRLIERWGSRFTDLPQTADYDLIARFLSSLDVQMFFGQGECFASSIAEASGVGLPNIALVTPLRDNGQSEQVADGQTGYLVGTIGQAVERVAELMNSPSKLITMKLACRTHCLERWSADRVAADLLSLYQGWRGLAVAETDYAKLMLREVSQFGQSYRQQMVDLVAEQKPLSRMIWNAKLRAVEHPLLFKLGRLARKVMYRKQYRGLTDAAKR